MLKLERGTIERSNETLTVALPARGSIVYLIGVLVWFVFMIIIIGGNVMASDLKLAMPVVLVFGALLAVAVGAVVSLMLWVFIGQEVITVRGSVMELSRRMPGRRFDVRVFSLNGVGEMRGDTVGDVRPATRGWSHIFGLSGGTIAFEYEGATHRFGARLSPGDAHIVIANIMAASDVRVDEAREDPAYHEATVLERGRGILIEVPPARVKSVTSTSAMFLLIVGVAIVMTGLAGVSGAIKGDVALFVVVFPVLVIVIGGWALLTLAANLWRRETVAVDENTIVIIRHVLGMDFRTELAIVPEAKLWLDAQHSEEAQMGGRFQRGIVMKAPLNVGPIVYQGARGQLFRFGNGLSRSEAAFLVSRIHEKSPSLID